MRYSPDSTVYFHFYCCAYNCLAGFPVAGPPKKRKEDPGRLGEAGRFGYR